MKTRHDSLLSMIWPSCLGFLALFIAGVIGLEFMLGALAFSAGENLWAKNQKNLGFYLLHYLNTGDKESEKIYKKSASTIHHFRRARELMMNNPHETDAMREAMIQGGMTQNDIKSAIRIQWYVGHSSLFKEAYELWHNAEEAALKLEPMYEEAAALLSQPIRDQAALNDLSARIVEADRTAQPLEELFSNKMNELSHLAANVLIGIEISLLALILFSVTWRTREILEARKRISATLTAERQKAVITMEAIGDAIITTNDKDEVEYMNEAAVRLCQQQLPAAGETSLPLHELVTMMDEASGDMFPSLFTQLQESTDGVIRNESSYHLVRKDGSSTPVSWIGSIIRDNEKITGAVLVIHDTTREKQLIERLNWLATHDPLTSLMNRRTFKERLEQAIGTLCRSGKERRENHGHVLIFIDLDQFKVVNDTSGHVAGDKLLRLISKSVSECLRSNDVFARLGGDEFGIILLNCSQAAGEERAEQIRKLIAQTELTWGSRRISSTASLGLVHLDSSDTTLTSALSAADLVCYKAKDSGRNRVETYHEDDTELLERHGEMTWVQKIHRSIEEDKFQLYAQPVIPLQKDLPPHFELLLRLINEDGVIIPPGAFIPAAERFGLMPLIDRWVVRSGLKKIAELNAENPANRDSVFSINLSGATFREKGFAEEVKAFFTSFDVEPRQICFEITETHAVTNMQQAIEFITKIRNLGCSFALDDFGSGMSSFGYLKEMPVNYLKIDGKIVKGMCSNTLDKAIVEMINQLGHAIQTSTIGEYAETEEIVEALRKCGVDFGQGYALGHPAPWSEIGYNKPGS